jgi:hypothetical protein
VVLGVKPLSMKLSSFRTCKATNETTEDGVFPLNSETGLIAGRVAQFNLMRRLSTVVAVSPTGVSGSPPTVVALASFEYRVTFNSSGTH